MTSSCGKIILAGEHAVVYNKPAIILPIDKKCEAHIQVSQGEQKILNEIEDEHKLVQQTITSFFQDFKISPVPLLVEIKSNIPVGRGFGSSAAIVTALAKELCRIFEIKVEGNQSLLRVLDFCVACENLVHQNSSGADIYATWFGRPLWFRKEHQKLRFFESLNLTDEVKRIVGNFVLVDTGKPVESTGEMVLQAKALKNRRPKYFNQQISRIEEETLRLLSLFLEERRDAKAVFDFAIWQIEKKLERLGVVSERVKTFIKELRRFQIPAKICGAGGRAQGSGVVLVLTKDKKELENLCRAAHYFIIDAKIAI